MVGSHGRFVWHELLTTDVAAATTFYARVMRWGAWDASTPGRPYILFGDGKSAISALTPLPDEARRSGVEPTWVGYVGVDDVDATAERVVRLGGAIQVPPTNVADVSRFSVVTDPQGARLALFKWRDLSQQPPVTPEATGRVGWHELLAADWEQAWTFYAELFGWQKEKPDVSETVTYQPFSTGGQMIGGILTKPPTISAPFWLCYFNTDDIDAAKERVTTGGGQVLEGPLETADGSWVIQCTDPQGAAFALEGPRKGRSPGYFESSPQAPGGQARRWSW